jgi:flagellar hook-associated protein 2
VLPAFTPGNYLTLDANNSTFDIEVDGVPSGLLTLTAGEYQSGAALAEEMQARINGASNLVKAEVSVTVTYDASNNRFNIVSDSVGSTSTVNVLGVGTNVAAALGFSVQDGSPGLNVAGTIGGVAGTGSGDVLEAATTSAAKGLKLTIGGSTTGGRGSVNFTRGVMNQLDQFLDRILDTDGSLDDRIDNLNDRLKAVEDRRDSQEIRWTAVKERYLAQFNALDSLISKLNTTGSFLTSQLASLPGVVSKQ